MLRAVRQTGSQTSIATKLATILHVTGTAGTASMPLDLDGTPDIHGRATVVSSSGDLVKMGGDFNLMVC